MPVMPLMASPAAHRFAGAEGSLAGPPLRSHRASSTLVGPQRFFYEKSTYTGVHRAGTGLHGGPTVVDIGLHRRDGGRIFDISELMRPGMRSGGTLGYTPAAMYDEFRPTQASNQAATHLRDPSLDRRANGPERFYYDKASYTGVHKNGGPWVRDALEVPRLKAAASEMPLPPRPAKEVIRSISRDRLVHLRALKLYDSTAFNQKH